MSVKGNDRKEDRNNDIKTFLIENMKKLRLDERMIKTKSMENENKDCRLH